MSGRVLTYSPSDVKLTICGYNLGGLLNINVTLSVPQMQIRRGIRGQSTRIRNSDLSATLTVDVLQTSVTNDVLFQIWALDRQKQVARLDLALSDNSGRTVLQTAQAYVAGLPEVSFTEGFSSRKWVFEILAITDGSLTGASDQNIDFFSGLAGSDILKNISGLADSAAERIGGLF